MKSQRKDLFPFFARREPCQQRQALNYVIICRKVEEEYNHKKSMYAKIN